VLRQGRVSNAQRRAHDTLLPRFGIEYSASGIDFDGVFGRRAPRVLEIGFGMGETTAQIAASHPERDYVAIEVHTPGVGSLLKQIEERELNNVRIIQHDAVDVLQHMITPDTLDGAHIFFPDPWPKKRHHKRRLIQPGFVSLLASRIKQGGYVHAATDWDDYARQILEVMSRESTLRNVAPDFSPRPDYRPLTKFEQRGLKLGYGVRDIVFVKV
jgi:tRNA (guanine-N7-)-methyltransferase